MTIKVNFKVSGSNTCTFSLNLEPSLTVWDTKKAAKDSCSIEPDQMKIIFKGRILKDSDSLEAHNVESGTTVHIVKAAPNGGSATETQHVAPTMGSPPGIDGNTGMNGSTDPAMIGAGSFDPAMVQQMLQNPAVSQALQSLANNPAQLQQIIQGNPMLQSLSQQDPMLAQMLSNVQVMQSMVDPNTLQNLVHLQTQNGGNGAARGNLTIDPALMQAAVQAVGGEQLEEAFAAQLPQLEGMGFKDRRSNLQALQMANGDVHQAVNLLSTGSA